MTNPPIQQEQNPEPWVPEGMPEFKMGVTVRWRISPECEFRCEDCGTDMHMEGRTGIGKITALNDYEKLLCLEECSCSNITGCGGFIPITTHIYFIEVRPCLEHDDDGHGFWATASELILVEDDEDLCWMEDDPIVCARGTHGCDVHEPVLPLTPNL